MLLQLWSSQILADASPLQLSIAGFLAAFLGFIVCQVIYNVYFHPLAAYPGPWLARASLLWRMIWSMQGRFHRVIDEQHKKYGPVFRVSPNELSFASQGSWRDIYGYKSALSGQETNIKSEFYEMFASGYKTMCVGSEQDPQIHSQMKRDLSPTFSTKAIIGQEPIIRSRIDAFLNKLDEVRKSSPNGIDITMWANIVVFDIFGEMAFGESFHAIEAGKPHFWPSLMTKHMFFITVLDNLRRYPWISWAGRKCLPALTTATRDRHAAYTQYHVEKRMAQKQPRCDFVANLIDQHDNGNMSKDQMISHASTFVIAGGDSASTFLPAFIYFISRTPHAYAKFLNEIDSTFDTYEGINAEAVLKMPYLQACISEALRIHPPGSHGFPRLAAGSYIDGYWVPRGTEIYTSAWSVTHNEKYFHEPFSFLPERWIGPNDRDCLSASRPFSLGPRECLGRHFALVHTSLLLACTFFKYDIRQLDPDFDWEKRCRIHVLWNKPPMFVELKPRVRNTTPIPV